MNASDTSRIHDSSRQDLCPCKRCDLERIVAIAGSRAMSAAQAAAWRPRSKRLAAQSKIARQELDSALFAQAKYLRESQQ